MTVFIATAFISLGLLNFDFGPKWWRGQMLRLVLGVPIVLVYVYLSMPALVFPQAVVLLLLTLVPNAAYSLLLAARTALAARRVVSIRRTPARPYLIAPMAIGAFALVLAVAPIVDASGLRDVVDATVSTSKPPSADLAHVRVVPAESAIFTGDKVVGQLGAYYAVGTFNVQLERKKLVWVAPLEFQGFVQWLSRRTSPGVIVVSAENPDAGAELRRRAPMRYIPSALLNDNLYRHVYFRYGAEQILELTLQLDDKGDPRYLATLGRPTIGWTGQKVTGVVIVDPDSGAMQHFDRSQFDRLPPWVSRVYPPDLALAYNSWFGKFVHGLWNYLVAKRDVHVPARPEVFGLLAADRFVWFVDHTSPASDASMTGFTYMDSVTGKITYYTSSGGELNSRGAEDAVGSNPTVRQGRLTPTQPLLYNAFGHNTWVVPLVANTGKYQTLALVEASNGHVVVGAASNASPQIDAFAQYAAFLGVAPTSEIASKIERPVTGTLDRVAASGGLVYFTVRGDRRVYALEVSGDAFPLLARSGDRVQFRSGAKAGAAIAASAFKDFSLGR
ncbi:MAG: hypothetical protein GIW95_05765 [Candidatus Eremiobacteraeota bacterium]|nr:hypothetical protein [Candidatus Eremiobacteraeota bacterium]